MKYVQRGVQRSSGKRPSIKKVFSWIFKTLKSKKFWGWVLKIAAAGMVLIVALFIYYAKDLPDPNKLLSRQVPQSTKIYSRDGVLLYEIHGEVKRTLIPYSEMNDYVRNATIAIEDKNFYNEGGINLKGIARSIVVDILTGSKAQGGSTITQQFVRNAILDRDKSYARKIKEIILSIEINERFSKNDVLKLYLNEIPYGRNAYGIEAAAQVYFNKHAVDLDLAQAAYLAALPQAPSYYNPTGPNRDALDARKNTVLQQMKDQGYITEQQYEQAKNEKVEFQSGISGITAPQFVFYIQNYLSQKYGDTALQQGGLKVTTTLDSKMQAIAEKAVADGAARNSKLYNGHNAALVAIDPKTGQILAMVGSKDFFADPEPAGCQPGVNCTFEPQVNVAIAQRQAGSSMKPYIYVTAFNQQYNMSPATMLMDVSTNFGTYGGKSYIPQDYDGKQRGPVSIRSALAESLNIPAVKTLDLIGTDSAIKTMRAVGITSPLQDCGLSLVLGGCEVTLLDHVAGYATFATEGVRHPVTGILEVDDANGNILEQFKDQPQQVLDPQAVYELDSILTDNQSRLPTFGSAAQYLTLPDRPVAAKTGTTQNYRDGWTVGFTPSLAAGVWTGNNNGAVMTTDAVITAGPIWKQFMSQALAGTPPEAFPVPDGIKNVTVDALSGKLPGPYTQSTKSEVFASWSVPTQVDDTHVLVQSNQPGESPKVYTILHSEKPNDPNWEGPVQAWAEANGYPYPPVGSTIVSSSGNASSQPNSGTPGNPPVVNIISPANGSEITQAPFTIQATAVPDQGNTITRVDLLIDGSTVQSSTTTPYNFIIQNLLSSGTHVIAIHAVDDRQNSTDQSIQLNFK